MGTKRDRWWVLKRVTALAIVALLATYIGAYFALAQPYRVPVFSTLMRGSQYSQWPRYPQKWMYSFFNPIHQIDRACVRRQLWNP
jgi:hypothetical protein